MFINSLARIKAEALARREAETGPNFYEFSHVANVFTNFWVRSSPATHAYFFQSIKVPLRSPRGCASWKCSRTDASTKWRISRGFMRMPVVDCFFSKRLLRSYSTPQISYHPAGSRRGPSRGDFGTSVLCFQTVQQCNQGMRSRGPHARLGIHRAGENHYCLSDQASLKSQAFTEHPKTQHNLEHIANMVTPNW